MSKERKIIGHLYDDGNLKLMPNTNFTIDNISDGFHTFGSLYHQRAILFAVLVNLNSDISWKSWLDENGNKWFDSDEWFLVCIDTPEGAYSYHYKREYWGYFDCQELDRSKPFDGHTEKDVFRLLSLAKKRNTYEFVWEPCFSEEAINECKTEG